MPNTDTAGLVDDVATEQQNLKREYTQRIAHSDSFRSAPMLQHLLLYLTKKAESGEAGALKEYSIGVEALGRKADFDPKIDPIVRVQMHRLRQKLREYYASEGSADPLVLEIPKGHYLPSYHAAKVAGPPDIEIAEPEVSQSSLSDEQVSAAPMPIKTDETPRRWRSSAMALVGMVAFLGGLLAALLWIHAGTKKPVQDKNFQTVQAFWSQFLGSDTAPVIAYPDAVFLLDESNDLFRFREGATDQRGSLVNPDVALEYAANPALAAKAGRLYYENGYTGTGELEAIAMLSRLFARMGVNPTIKSSRDITTADLEQHNVILLGSPFQNTAVAELPVVGDFVFDNPDAHLELWRARILNLHPGAHESSWYQTVRNPSTGTLKADYGLVSIMQGVAPGVHIAILGGLDTTGTKGATGLAVSAEGVEKMKSSMSLLDSGTISGFQALLKVNLEKGYQVLDAHMVALHDIRKADSNSTNPSLQAQSPRSP